MGSQYIIQGATGSNATAGASAGNTAVAALAASGKNIRLISVLVDPYASSLIIAPGQWVVDVINALGATGSSPTPTPLQASNGKAAAGTAKSSATLAVAPTSVQDAALILNPGWNHFAANGIHVSSGASQGFGLRRAVAPGGSHIVNWAMVIEED